MITQQSLVTLKPGLRIDHIDDSLVIVDKTSDQVHHLNSSATVIWTACEDTTSVEKLTQAMLDSFDISPDIARQDVIVVLEQLRDRQLLDIE